MSTYINIIEFAQFLPLVILALALAVVFKPLLRGIARAALLVVKPKLSKEERIQRRLMRDTMLFKRMLNSMEGSPSHVAELRAMACRA
jgi:hypothetical protein